MSTFTPQTKLATYVYYVFEIEPPIANDDMRVPRNIVAVGFNFDIHEQKIDPSINCPYYELAKEYGYVPRLAQTPSEHLMCMQASTDSKGQKISIVQAQRNIQRFELFLKKKALPQEEDANGIHSDGPDRDEGS